MRREEEREAPGAINQVAKQQNIASKTVTAATQLWDALQTLKQLKEERAVAGAFTDENLHTAQGGGQTDLQHVSAAVLGSFFDFVVSPLDDWFNDPTNPGRKNWTLELRR